MNNEQKPQEQHTREVFADLGSSIQQLRHHHGLTVEQAAEAADTTTEQKPEPEPAQEPEPPTAKNTTEDAPDLVALAAKLQEAKKAVIFCLNNPTGSVNFHGLEYWAGEVERLRKEILKAA